MRKVSFDDVKLITKLGAEVYAKHESVIKVGGRSIRHK